MESLIFFMLAKEAAFTESFANRRVTNGDVTDACSTSVYLIRDTGGRDS